MFTGELTREERVRQQREYFGNFKEDAVRQIGQFLDLKDKPRLVDGLPFTRDNEVLCLPSGNHPHQQPAPVFRTNPGRDGCGDFTTSVNGCCTRDLLFSLFVALIVRTAHPNRAAAIERIPKEMRTWVDGLYANANMVPVSTLVLTYDNYDDMLLLDFATDTGTDAPILLKIRGDAMLFPRGECCDLRGPLIIYGTEDAHIDVRSLSIEVGFGQIPVLVIDHCSMYNWDPNLPPHEEFADMVSRLGKKKDYVRLTLPTNVTYAQLETELVNNHAWQTGPPGTPPTFTDQNLGLQVTLKYDVPNRRVLSQK